MNSVIRSVLLVCLVVGCAFAGGNHCPENCVATLSTVCDDVEGLLSKVPVIEKRVPFVLDIVGRAICFPEEMTPNENSLCPKHCGEPGSKAEELFSKVCNYVDDILQATPIVTKEIRDATDFAICAIADLIPVDKDLDLTGHKDKRDSHCPSNCLPKLADLCDEVEGMLENVPVVGKVPEILNIVGKAICFPSSTKPSSGSLCPKSCGKKSGKKSDEMFTKVCNYVDNILQSTPGVTSQIRNLTDHAICTIGSLIPDQQDALDAIQDDSFCPENCEEDLQKVCKFVEDIVNDVPSISKVVDQEIGRAICFPASATPHKDSLCPDECGNEDAQKICEYVDLLMQTPGMPKEARKLTTSVICKLAELFDHDMEEMKKQSMGLLRRTIQI